MGELTKKGSKKTFFFKYLFIYVNHNYFFFFAKPPRQAAHAFVVCTFLVSNSLEGQRSCASVATKFSLCGEERPVQSIKVVNTIKVSQSAGPKKVLGVYRAKSSDLYKRPLLLTDGH